MSKTKRYLELTTQRKIIDKELESLKAEILGALGDAPMILLDGCAVSKRVTLGYETITADSFRAMRSNPTMAALIAPYVTTTAKKQSLDIKILIN